MIFTRQRRVQSHAESLFTVFRRTVSVQYCMTSTYNHETITLAYFRKVLGCVVNKDSSLSLEFGNKTGADYKLDPHNETRYKPRDC